MGAYDDHRVLLGSTCSAPITVLANNDAPLGPAIIDLDMALADSWEGMSHPHAPGIPKVQVSQTPRRFTHFDG